MRASISTCLRQNCSKISGYVSSLWFVSFIITGTNGLWAMNTGHCLLFSSVSALSCTNDSLAEKNLFLYCHCSGANWLIQCFYPVALKFDDRSMEYVMTVGIKWLFLKLVWLFPTICNRKNTVLDPTAWGCCSSMPPNMTSNKAENTLLVGTSP